MKPTFTLFLLLSLFLVINVNDARKTPAAAAEYWKKVTKGQPIPEAIKDLFVEDPASLNNEKIHFVKNFDTRSIAVIYRSHDDDSKTISKEYTKKGEDNKKVSSETNN